MAIEPKSRSDATEDSTYTLPILDEKHVPLTIPAVGAIALVIFFPVVVVTVLPLSLVAVAARQLFPNKQQQRQQRRRRQQQQPRRNAETGATEKQKKQQPVWQQDSGYEVQSNDVIPRPDRQFDVVLLGASGFVGQKVFKYLAETYGTPDSAQPEVESRTDRTAVGSAGGGGWSFLRGFASTNNNNNNNNNNTAEDGASAVPERRLQWAIAGRNRAKLEAIKANLGEELGLDLSAVSVLVVDTLQQPAATMPTLVRNTRVVATCVGPYSYLGAPVVEFCAKFGTHYVDLTGEVGFVKVMKTKSEKVAQETGARIIPFVGQDSVPFDLATMKLQQTLKDQCNDDLVEVTFFNTTFITAAPPGTAETLTAKFQGRLAQYEPEEVTTAPAADPFLVLPNGETSRYVCTANLPLTVSPARRSRRSHRHCRFPPQEDLWSLVPYSQKHQWRGRRPWKSLHPLADINAEVVRWSYALRQQGSPHLRYKEWWLCPDMFTAVSIYLVLVMSWMLVTNPLTAALLQRTGVFSLASDLLLTVEAVERRHFLYLQGQGVGQRGHRAEAVFYFKRDPGIVESGHMIVEAAVALAWLEEELPVTSGGFYTPAVALGNVLLKRIVDEKRIAFVCRILVGDQQQQQEEQV